MKINKVEELVIWKEAVSLVKDIYSIISAEDIRKDFTFVDQVKRAALSIPCNIAEGFERNSNKEFKRYL